jgi:hypothetical protein
MKRKKQTVSVKLQDEDKKQGLELLTVEVTGDYYPPYHGSIEQPPEDAEFEITDIKLSTGSLLQLLEYINDNVSVGENIFEHLEEKAKESYEETEAPYED